jgi:adenosylhomocysteine nucleosidase
MEEFLVTMALEIESQNRFEAAAIPVLYTGVGKINAAYSLTRALMERRSAGLPPPHVLNFGTAGSPRHRVGALIACNRFVQLDMDASPLGFAPGHTPFDQAPAVLEFPVRIARLPLGTCGSTDTFQVSASAERCDVLDMEAFALAKVCWVERLQFTCVKYITDGADHTAAVDWESNLPKAATEFLEVYEELRRSWACPDFCV